MFFDNRSSANILKSAWKKKRKKKHLKKSQSIVVICRIFELLNSSDREKKNAYENSSWCYYYTGTLNNFKSVSIVVIVMLRQIETERTNRGVHVRYIYTIVIILIPNRTR